MNRRPLFRMPFTAAAAMLICCCGAVGFVEVASLYVSHQLLTASRLADLARLVADQIGAVWAFAALAYGAARARGSHPSVRKGYADWLAGTPWRPGRPLPLGPPHLVWEDLVPAAVIAYLSPRPVEALLAFTLAYAAFAVGVTVGGRDQRWVAATAVVAVGGVVRFWPSAAVVAIAAVVLVACDVAVRRSLPDLPWVRPVAEAARAAVAARAASRWPMAPVDPPALLPAADGWTIAAVAAWMTYCLAWRAMAEDPSEEGLKLTVAMSAAVYLGLGRLVPYTKGYQSPISLWGRLWTGRWIIPGYDRVLVAPLTAMAIGIAVPAGLWGIGVPVPIAAAVGMLGATAVVTRAGPSRRNWQMTGHFRFVPRRRTAARSTSGLARAFGGGGA